MTIGTRISVVGSPGSGKTSVAAAIAGRRGLRHIELDALHWGPGWSAATAEDMQEQLSPLLIEDGWVVDGNYGGKARDLVWRHADTVVWLDLPKRTVMSAVARRSVRRAVLREPLWNENRERLRNLVRRSEHENLLVWTWKHFDRYRETYAAAMADSALRHLRFVRLRSRNEVEDFLGGLDPVTPR